MQNCEFFFDPQLSNVGITWLQCEKNKSVICQGRETFAMAFMSFNNPKKIMWYVPFQFHMWIRWATYI